MADVKTSSAEKEEEVIEKWLALEVPLGDRKKSYDEGGHGYSGDYPVDI